MKYITGAIIAIILFAGGILLGKYYFSTQEIKVVEKKVYKTIYKTKYIHIKDDPEFNLDNFNDLLTCYNSPITFQDRTESNHLYVTAQDDCKQAEARYKIGTKGNWTYYAMFGLGGLAVGGLAVLLLR